MDETSLWYWLSLSHTPICVDMHEQPWTGLGPSSYLQVLLQESQWLQDWKNKKGQFTVTMSEPHSLSGHRLLYYLDVPTSR